MFDAERCSKILKAGAFVVIAISVAVSAYSYSLSVERSYPTRSFSVDGVGKIEAKPDIASISVSVVSEGDTNVGRLQNVSAEKMRAVDAFLKDNGVDAKDVKTTAYSLLPRYNPNPCQNGICPDPVISGYSLTETLSVKVRKTDALGDILSGVVSKGANSVSSVQFVLDDDAASKREAREAAIRDAQQKAKEIARAGGFRLGKLVAVFESVPAPNPGDGIGGMGGADMMKSASAPIVEPGTNTQSVQMTLSYEIID